MTNENMVHKILSSIPPRYQMKVTAIEEVHDLSTMKVDELIGSLMTYELSLPRNDKRHNGLALKSFLSL